MIKIIEIENAFVRINGDIFQEFCNHFLYLKLNPNSINPTGSVIGKEKSRKGIPDSYFTNADGELIFAEYTTKEKLERGITFINKLKSDIENCFDTSKTGLKPEEINKVILCFTERLKPEESLKLEQLCKKFNPKCILDLKGIRDLAYAVMDYPILGSYLGIQIGTGQIQEPSDFIANYEKNKLSTPLGNPFCGRIQEIEDGLNNLEKNNILLVYGAPGTGKSKYAIELAKRYSDKNKTTFLCIGNNGIPIWEDIKSFIIKDKNYILLVDDANRLAKNFQWILSLLDERNSNSLKIVATVRDYAFSQIKDIAKNYDYSTIEIKEFTDEDIKEIIKTQVLNIDEPPFVERILKIAKGNARLAIMSAKVAQSSKNINQLNDASQIYDEYFNPIFEEIPLLNEPLTLKSLALISFFSRIDKENRELCESIFNRLEIDENSFWEICYSLNENELVDLFEHQIVKISDQIFSTYIFYKAVIDLETLNFNFFLNNYLEYENRINDTIVPVLNTFNYKKIEKKLRPIILTKWIDIEKLDSFDNSLKFLNLFWFYLSSQVLKFLKRHIDVQKVSSSIKYRYTYELNEFSSGTGKDIEMLSRFKYLGKETFKDSLELLLYYGINVPDKLPAIIYTIKEKFSFTRLGYMYGDYIQHIFLDFLIEKTLIEKDRIIYENILLEIIPSFLKIEHHENEGNGRSITLYTFHLWLSESIKSFRGKCFNYLLQSENKSIVLQTIYRLSFFEYKNSKAIYEYDKTFLLKIIKKYFQPKEFIDCFVLQHILEDLDWLKLAYPKTLKERFKNKLFLLTEILKTDRKRRIELSWEEELKLHQKELFEYCEDFGIEEYKDLFNNVATVLKTIKSVGKGNLEWQYESSLNIIFGNLAKQNSILFIQILNLNFEHYNFNLNFEIIFNHFFQYTANSFLDLYYLIKDKSHQIKICFHQTINTSVIEETDLQTLYLDFIYTLKSLSNQYFFWDLTFISKYKTIKNEQDLYIEILDIFLSKIKQEDIKISVGAPFIEKCITFKDFPIEPIIEAYFYASKFEQHFDYEKKLFRILLIRDATIIIRFLKFSLPHRISYHELENENFEFIWELENYNDIINLIFEYFIESETYYFSERAASVFFTQAIDKYGNKPIDYLKTLIDKKYLSEKYMDVVFNIICYKYPNLKMELLERYLRLSSDFEVFKTLELVQRSNSWSGSYIPILEGEKKIWDNVLSVLEMLPNRLDYFEHKEYVNRQLGYSEIRIKDEIKREFNNEYS